MKLLSASTVVTILCSMSIASDQLSFSKDTVSLHIYPVANILTIKNVSDSVISIDTIFYSWKINKITQYNPIGLEIETLYTENGYAKNYVRYRNAYTQETSDSTFYFDVNIEEQQIIISPGDSLVFENIKFGNCIGCVQVSKKQMRYDSVSIHTIFKNNQGGTDTVEFIGMGSDLVTSISMLYTVKQPSTSADLPQQKSTVLASGRKIENPHNRKTRRTPAANLYLTTSGRGPIIVKLEGE
ncbi:MAG: hypothetical protein JW863_23735 [Chitinispirillaceae bacterium]|nr:hypothetical protein [Chitinispirillaceae bacterium]